MVRIRPALAIVTVAIAMLIIASAPAIAQTVPFDPADCEYIEGQSFCEGALVDMIGGTVPVSLPVCYVIDDSGNLLAVYVNACPTSG